jgi:hypothetical protein
MWIFTKDGFFSVVKDDYCNAGELMVRAWIKNDLQHFLAKIDKQEKEIITLTNADYRYRTKVIKEDWGYYCGKEAANIDYNNVKGTIAPHDQPERATAYYGCWNHLYHFQQGVIKTP